ncbi:hypothetical protein KMZ68_02650 [Bradyrhizobium sediminis]|uniref:Uncharacterized protein n=1 Tax=Bradyrhizobium sediminis TaxID=2840469 RepID=A0A975RSP2_9BRAD|nr:hypothetical protein [Bradyrhizobium sediminis]QWG18810.1 hypothetical protein KMZ68_02650 [Bradyrhizobium sediminis]
MKNASNDPFKPEQSNTLSFQDTETPIVFAFKQLSDVEQLSTNQMKKCVQQKKIPE